MTDRPPHHTEEFGPSPDTAGLRDCPACGAPLADDETHWSIFPEPMGDYVCPDRPPVSGEPSPHSRRRLNRLHALRTKWGDCYWKPGDGASAPEWADDPCEALEPDLIEFENDVRADFTALIRKAEARATPPSLAEDDLDEVLSLLGPDALRRLQRHGFTVARLTSEDERR